MARGLVVSEALTRIRSAQFGSAYLSSSLAMWDDRSQITKSLQDLPTILDALRRLGGPSRDGEWGVLEVAEHFARADAGYLRRLRAAVEGLEPPTPSVPPQTLVVSERTWDEFLTSRAKLMEFVGSLKDEDWEKVYITPRGEERTVRETFRMLVYHDRDHLEQAARATKVP